MDEDEDEPFCPSCLHEPVPSEDDLCANCWGDFLAGRLKQCDRCGDYFAGDSCIHHAEPG